MSYQRDELRRQIIEKFKHEQIWGVDKPHSFQRHYRYPEKILDCIMEAIDEFIGEGEEGKYYRFSIGDTVRVTAHNDHDAATGPEPGLVGLVVGYSKGNHEGMVLVEFDLDDWDGGHNGMDDCVDENGDDINRPTFNGWFKDPDTLEKM